MAARGSRIGAVPVVAGLLAAWGVFGLMSEGSRGAIPACVPDDAACAEPVIAGSEAAPLEPATVLQSRSACANAGYLCAGLATEERIRLRRWKDFSGTIVVHVPRPDFEDRGEAARLQEAAGRGLRAWNGQPFQILTDYRGDREAHFSVRWTRALPGNRIGTARTQWSPGTGLQVLAIELSTRSPYDPSVVHTERQVQLTAAHEMGHALGLQHSDSESDVMYPSNTAVRISAQDYRTMEVLYALEDGTEIVR